jgi:hypothetical protein
VVRHRRPPQGHGELRVGETGRRRHQRHANLAVADAARVQHQRRADRRQRGQDPGSRPRQRAGRAFFDERDELRLHPHAVRVRHGGAAAPRDRQQGPGHADELRPRRAQDRPDRELHRRRGQRGRERHRPHDAVDLRHRRPALDDPCAQPAGQ